MAAEVVLTPRAQDDLFSIYIWVAEAAGVDVADAYDARLREACLALAHFPERGRRGTISRLAFAACPLSGGP